MISSVASQLPPLAALCAAVVPRGHRNPFPRRDLLRRSRRLASGMSPKEVARADGVDEAEIQGLLATESFRRLVASWQALEAKPPEERRRRLVTLAFQAIGQALADWDLGAAFFVLREDAQGRDPAVTVADGVIAASKRQARAGAAVPSRSDMPATSPAPDPRSPSMAESGLRVIQRRAERLRAATFAEHAARHAAIAAVADEKAAAPPPPSTGAAAAVAAARRAFALRVAARRPVAAAGPAPDHAEPTAGAAPVTPAAPIASLPRRPRAP
jgi:hypothetical protein